MAHNLCQVHMMEQSGCGIQWQVQTMVNRLNIPIMCHALPFPVMASILHLVLMTRQSGYGMLHLARQLESHSGTRGVVRSVAFSPGGTIIASGSYDATIRLWKTTTGELIKELTGHDDASHL